MTIHTTLSGRFSDDPYFDVRSLRAGYNDWHETEVPLEEREIVPAACMYISYRVLVSYTDAGDTKIRGFELMLLQSAEDRRRGRPVQYKALDLHNPIDRALLTLMQADVETDTARSDIQGEIERDQEQRDEDLAMEDGR